MSTQDGSQTPAQPSLSDDVAITALVISLFALVVGLSQFLQAILGTAEGYRRCSASVIGPWSRLRRRVFQWSEFRYETRYMVPSIALVPLPELGHADSVREAYESTDLVSQSRELLKIRSESSNTSQRLRSGEHAGHVCDLAMISPELETTTSSLKFRANSLLLRLFPSRTDPTDVLLETLRMPPSLKDMYVTSKIDAAREEWRTSLDFQRTASNMPRSDSEAERGTTSAVPPVSARNEASRLPDTFTVTWIRLIRELHALYRFYASDQWDSCLGTSTGELGLPASEQMGTTVVVTPVVETWDFMPQDVSRPMASSTVGHMTVLALRLGMQWRLLDRARMQMNADGNGFNISSTEIKGLGMAFRFSVFARLHYLHAIVPGEAADKMMCGIIPGDPTLVRTDFRLIDHDRKLIELWQPGSVYAKLGLDEGTITLIKDRNRWTTHNEIITILCSWVPVLSSRTNAFVFSGWKTRQYSVFHFFESRLAFTNALSRISNRTQDTDYILEKLETLSRDYPQEFFVGSTSNLAKEHDQEKRVAALTSACLGIFRHTTKYFVGKGYADDNGSDKTWYMQLVAAHARLSARVNWTLDLWKPSSQSEILQKYDSVLRNAGVETTYFAEYLWDLTERYIDGVEDEEFGVYQYMKERGFMARKDDVIEAWWMLMLRGIVWDLGCQCLPFPGEPVPSSYYNDETTVWIT